MTINRIDIKNSSYFIISALILRFFLEIAYVELINPIFEYLGFTFDFQYSKYIESWLIYIFFVTLSPQKLNKPSDYINDVDVVLFYFAIINFLCIF